MSAVPVPARQQSLKENEKKWGKKLMDAGWTCIPSVILQRQRQFGLDPVDVNILLLIASHWWFADELPFPGKQSIAEAMNLTARTVQRHLAKLEFAGLIERKARWHDKRGRQSNFYDLSVRVSHFFGPPKRLVSEAFRSQTEVFARAGVVGKASELVKTSDCRDF